MNVLYCVPIGHKGGVERFLEDVIVRHDPARVKPVLLAFSDGPWLKELSARNVSVYAVEGARLRHPWHTFQTVNTILKKERIDVVHSAYSWCHALTAAPAVWNGCKQVWFHHGPISPRAWQGFTPLLPTDLLLANSNFLAEQLKRTLYWAKKTAVVHYGIDATQFEPDAQKRRIFRQTWNLDDSDVAIGLVGYIDVWKGQDIFLQAALHLSKKVPAARMFVIGGPRQGPTRAAGLELEARLRRFVEDHGLQSRVSFTGHLDLREGALDGLDVMVHASTQPEPFGMVLLEAMAKGKPIVASAEGGPLEILTDGVQGLLVTPRDPQLLADRIELLANDAARREILGRNAQELVVQRFGAAAATRALEGHYQELVG